MKVMKMGTDNIFKQRNRLRKERKAEYKIPKANSYLIVTEGERTEPLYFSGIKKIIEQRLGGTIDIKEADYPSIEICGEGCSTNRLIEATEKIIRDSKILYQNIWVVFDKDDFDDFDEAIKIGNEKGYNIAWSNQCFEYWLFLHFAYSDSALHRDVWSDKMDEIFKKYGIKDGKYQKNYEDIYEIVNTYGSAKTAIIHAKRRMADYGKMREKPSEYDPGTMVHNLVEELHRYLDEYVY